MPTRFRKIRRDLVAHRGRTLLVAISIFTGVLGVVSLQSGADILLRTLDNDLNPAELTMLALAVEADDATPANTDALLQQISTRAGVTVAEGLFIDPMLWKRPADAEFVQASLHAGTLPHRDRQIEPVTLIAGDFPAPDANALLVEQRMAERYDLAVGDEIEVRLLAELGMNPLDPVPVETFEISGLVFHPYNYFGNDTALYGTFATAQRITGAQGIDRVLVRYDSFTTAEDDADSIRTDLGATPGYTIRNVNTSDPNDNALANEAEQWADTVVVLAIIAMLVSSFLVVTVIGTIVREQRGEIGVLKSIGADRVDNFSIYAGIALAYGVLGTVPGVLIGVFVANWLAIQFAPLLGIYLTGFHLSAQGLVVGTLLGLLVPVVASILPVVRGTAVSIIDAMTDLGIKADFGRGAITRGLGRLPVAFNVRQGIISVYQKRFRLLLTALMLTLATGSFMGVTSVFLSIGGALDTLYGTFNFDAAVFPQEDEHELTAVAALLQDEFDTIETVYFGHNAVVDVIRNPADPLDADSNQYRVTLNAIDPRFDAINFTLDAGRLWDDPQTDNGVVISREVVDELGLGVGDEMTVLLDDVPLTVPVIGLDQYPFQRIFMNLNALEADDTLDFAADALFLSFTDDDLTGNEVDQLTGEMREVLLQNGVVPGFFNNIAAQETDADLLSTVGIVFNLASGIMAIIGAAGLLVMLSISVYERQREIGVMRSIGASSSAIATQFLAEGVVLGVLAWVLGIPIAVVMHDLLKSALPVGGLAGSFEPLTLAFGLVGVVVVATIASLWPSLSAARKTVADVLRYA